MLIITLIALRIHLLAGKHVSKEDYRKDLL